MKFLLHNEKSLKNGFYLDLFFKNIFFNIYSTIIGNSFIYLVDKYLAEKLFFFFKRIYLYTSNLLISVKYLNFQQILKLFLIIIIQIIFIFLF